MTISSSTKAKSWTLMMPVFDRRADQDQKLIEQEDQQTDQQDIPERFGI